jgi:Flp pilus assembly protein TadD
LAKDALNRVLAKGSDQDIAEFAQVLTSSFSIGGNDRLSVPLLEAALSSGRKQSDLRAALQQVYSQIGDSERVRAELARQGATDPLARLPLAIALHRDGRADEALAEINEILVGMSPDSPPQTMAEVFAYKGTILKVGGEAADAFEKAILLDPSQASALNNLAWLLATSDEERLRNPRRAVELAQRACRLMPHVSAFRGTLAVAFAASGGNSEAEEALAEAQKIGRLNGNTNPELPELVRQALDRSSKNP